MKHTALVLFMIFINGCSYKSLQDALSSEYPETFTTDLNKSNVAKMEKLPALNVKCKKLTCRKK